MLWIATLPGRLYSIHYRDKSDYELRACDRGRSVNGTLTATALRAILLLNFIPSFPDKQYGYQFNFCQSGITLNV